MGAPPRIGVFGAGSIGCYVGGRLAATGTAVTLVGRDKLGAQIAQHGLHLTDFLGADLHVAPAALRYASDAEALADCGLVLVTVKSAGTEDAGRALARVLKPGTVVISFQNGLHNAEVLRGLLPDCSVVAGMVQFNVVNRGQGAFHQGSEGGLETEPSERLAPYAGAFEKSGIGFVQCADFVAVQWAKLLLNLNNAINALSNLPLKQELSQRAFRRCVALAQAEALALLDAAGIRPAKLTPLPPHWIPRLLTVPDALFRRLANRMLAIDPLARSSMWEDLEAGRRTEVDWLNGEVVRFAATLGRRAPVNARLVSLIRDAEQGGRRDWSGDELLAQLRQAG